MFKLLKLTLAVSLTAVAAPIAGGPCSVGTLNEYVALGSAGCLLYDGSLTRDITYSVAGDPTLIVPSDVGDSVLTSHPSQWTLRAAFPTFIFVRAGQTLDATMTATIEFAPVWISAGIGLELLNFS